nr:LysR substrate-binding domain-containing protein [Sulfuritalea hydrogenivorans]
MRPACAPRRRLRHLWVHVSTSKCVDTICPIPRSARWMGWTHTVGARLGSTAAVKQWVKAGMGVSLVLAGTIEDEVKTTQLVAIPLEGSPTPRKALHVIWRDSLSEKHAACRFGNWLAKYAA